MLPDRARFQKYTGIDSTRHPARRRNSDVVFGFAKSHEYIQRLPAHPVGGIEGREHLFEVRRLTNLNRPFARLFEVKVRFPVLDYRSYSGLHSCGGRRASQRQTPAMMRIRTTNPQSYKKMQICLAPDFLAGRQRAAWGARGLQWNKNISSHQDMLIFKLRTPVKRLTFPHCDSASCQ